MFSKRIVDSDKFVTLPVDAKLLYYDLAMHCDDDGFCNHPRRVMLWCRVAGTALAPLVEEGFVYDFDGTIVVRDWRIHNSLKSDRLKMPDYPDIARQIWIRPNGRYELEPTEDAMTLYDFKAAYIREKKNPFGKNGELQVYDGEES